MTNANNWTKWPAIIWLVICLCLHLGINGQSQKAITSNSIFEKTTFTCAGRPAGYYADIETGCQIYHMCDGLGRQFSYSCPNTTLFQQRMLICDHWYMVNCSKAESHYAANLLIGQRDKPFVNDEENSLRTPRPDLLDRPYAPDYSGESFRNQYKQTSPAQNQIQDTDSEKNNIKPIPFIISSQHNWKIPPPSRIILPPAYETENYDSENGKQFSSQISISTTNSNKNISTTTATNPPTTIPLKTLKEQNLANYKNAALLQRNQEYHTTDNDDLGTSHSTRYNTSADYNSAEISSVKHVNIYNKGKFENSPLEGDSKNQIKIPSKIYQPPFLYPIFNEDNTPSTESPIRISSAVPFTTPTKQFTTTTKQPLSKPTTHAGKPFSIPTTTISSKTYASDIHNKSNSVLQNQRFDFHKIVKNPRTPAPAQGFKPPTPRPPIHFTKTLKAPTLSLKSDNYTLGSKINSTSRLNISVPTNPPTSGVPSSNVLKPGVPVIELLPPFREFIQHDIATTQGPPIYYEWKVPSNGLEPPKLDPPIGVDGREYPDTIIDYNSISIAGNFAPSNEVDIQKTSASIKTPITTTNSLQISQRELSTTRPPTLRSVKDTAQPDSFGKSVIPKSTKSATTPISPTAPTDIVQLRKELSVPEYAFPLETIGRTGYLNVDSYNSFQLKIPEHHTDADKHLHWYGENPECPECHPSYVLPGTCQPCLRR